MLTRLGKGRGNSKPALGFGYLALQGIFRMHNDVIEICRDMQRGVGIYWVRILCHV